MSQPPALDTATLRATSTGTSRFATRYRDRFTSDFFRAFRGGPPDDLIVSSIGFGTYLGEPTDADDALYQDAIRGALTSGVNMLDTAINYRCQRSELVIGAALQQVIAAGEVARDEIVVATKGGYIPLELSPPLTRDAYQQYVQREFIDSQILHPDEIVAGGHSLAPRFLKYCIAKSRQNLGLRTIDLYYLHNPEQQLGSVAAEELDRRLSAAFSMLEEAVDRAEIRSYGIATWDALRAAPGSPGHLSLERLVGLARAVAGPAHHFTAVQCPFNLAMTEAVRGRTQVVGGRDLSVVDAASELGLAVIASASLMQARLVSGLPAEVRAFFPGTQTDAQAALEFVRAVPGITTALVGMKHAAHVRENLESSRGA